MGDRVSNPTKRGKDDVTSEAHQAAMWLMYLLLSIVCLIRSEGEGHPPLLEVDPTVGKMVDFSNIVPPEPGGSQTAPSPSAIEEQSKEEFVDDPDVPPLV